MISYFILFIAFAVIGWAMDSAYRSIEERRWTSGTLVPFFSPIYGFGGLTLVMIFKYLQINFFVQVIVAAIALIVVELLGGLFCAHVLKRRLWDYSDSRYNFQGHIDLLHSFYWLVLSALMRIILAYAGVI